MKLKRDAQFFSEDVLIGRRKANKIDHGDGYEMDSMDGEERDRRSVIDTDEILQ